MQACIKPRVSELWSADHQFCKVLLEHIHTHHLHIVYDCFLFTTALSSCNRDHVVCKAENICYLALSRVSNSCMNNKNNYYDSDSSIFFSFLSLSLSVYVHRKELTFKEV